jgi:DNA (cytosine-5)-methyltransferase 1
VGGGIPQLDLRIGSLFSGIGGLELGLEWSGLGHTVWQVEQDRFCSAVLAKHWPQAERFNDVRTVGKANLAPVDLVCGGFPCQDVSSSGKGAGLAGERSGLWREFARILGELRPQWVVVENVTSGARKWLDAIVRQLEQLGYAVLPLPLSASDCGAPHRRSRLFVVAYAHRGGELQPQGREPEQRGRVADGAAADAHRVHAGQSGRSESERANTASATDLAGVSPGAGSSIR